MKSAKCIINGKAVTVIQNENGSISIENLEDLGCHSVMAGLKEIARVKGIELNPSWNTQRTGRYVINQLAEDVPEDSAKENESSDSNVSKAAELYKRFEKSHDRQYNYYRALCRVARKKKPVKKNGFDSLADALSEDIYDDFDGWIDTGHIRLRLVHVFIDDDYDYSLVVDKVDAGIKGGTLETEGEMPEEDRALDLYDIKYSGVLNVIIYKLEKILKEAGEEVMIDKWGVKRDRAIFDYANKLLKEKLAASNVISLENHPLADEYPVTAVYVNESDFGIETETTYKIDKITKFDGCKIEYQSGSRVFSELLSPQDKINLAFLLESMDNCDGVSNDTDMDSSDKIGQPNGHDYVDLGLPSGLKWATCNVGAKTPGECGDYFAWGEIKKKEIFTEKNYHCDKSYKKYYVDRLSPSDDAARVNWGGDWRMPTSEDWEELCHNCKVVDETYEGQKGVKVIGVNGNSIFLPAGGLMSEERYDEDSMGYYWSSTSDQDYAPYEDPSCEPIEAVYLYLENSLAGRRPALGCPNLKGRFIGCLIRPVLGQNI